MKKILACIILVYSRVLLIEPMKRLLCDLRVPIDPSVNQPLEKYSFDNRLAKYFAGCWQKPYPVAYCQLKIDKKKKLV